MTSRRPVAVPRPPPRFLALAARNRAFRRVLGTADGWQWVAMRLPPGSSTGPETHRPAQVFHAVAGSGALLVGLRLVPLRPGRPVAVAGSVRHDLGAGPRRALALLVGYSSQQHPAGLVEPFPPRENPSPWLVAAFLVPGVPPL